MQLDPALLPTLQTKHSNTHKPSKKPNLTSENMLWLLGNHLSSLVLDWPWMANKWRFKRDLKTESLMIPKHGTISGAQLNQVVHWWRRIRQLFLLIYRSARYNPGHVRACYRQLCAMVDGIDLMPNIWAPHEVWGCVGASVTTSTAVNFVRGTLDSALGGCWSNISNKSCFFR